MAIDPNKTYRTRDGRAVRIYATDGTPPYITHGAFWDESGWYQAHWDVQGTFNQHFFPTDMDLVEVTLADELTKEIPWEALLPEIQWVAMIPEGDWRGFVIEPELAGGFWRGQHYAKGVGPAVAMPQVPLSRWRETLCRRPENRRG